VKAIAMLVGTRNATQVRTHAQKYFLRLEREKRKPEGERDSCDSPSDSYEQRMDQLDDGEDMEERDSTNLSSNDNNTESSQSSQIEQPVEKKPKLSPDGSIIVKSSKKRGTKRKQINSPVIQVSQEPVFKFASNSSATLSQQIVAESIDTVLAQLKGWTSSDYALFVDGLFSVQEEKDPNMKCKIIREKYLPQYSLSDVKKCYMLLQEEARRSTPINSLSSTIPPLNPEIANANTLDTDIKRIKFLSSPVPPFTAAQTEQVTHFAPIPFAGNLNEAVSLRFTCGNPYSLKYPAVNPFPSSYSSQSDTTHYFPHHSSSVDHITQNHQSRVNGSSDPFSTPLRPPIHEGDSYETNC